MLKDITLGQYYQTNSIIHKLDPRVKLMGTLVYIIALFLGQSIVMYAVAGTFLVALIIASKVPVQFMLKGLKPVIFLLVFSAVFNLFLTEGEPLVQWGWFKITWEGVRAAVYMVVRLIFLIVGSSILTLTTTPNSLTDGLEKGLGFLRIFKVPVHEVAMMMSIALRFIPILTEETDKIMKAQTARGADFESGGVIKRSKAMVPILVPLFVSAFRRANDLAMAMEARCYHGSEGRTKFKPLKYKSCDYVGYLVLAAFLATMIALKVLL